MKLHMWFSLFGVNIWWTAMTQGRGLGKREMWWAYGSLQGESENNISATRTGSMDLFLNEN